MIQQIFESLNLINEFLWGYIGLGLIVTIGVYFTFRSGAMQLLKMPKIIGHFFHLCKTSSGGKQGVRPLRAFFASIGGCIGVGNIVSVCAAIQLGGPGALFWLWVTAFFGMILKYSEVFIGIKHRVKNDRGSYDGGPMYYLPYAFKVKWPATLAAILLCIYGVEIHVFDVVADSIADNWGLSRLFVVPGLLLMVLLAVKGGVDRVGQICSAIIPVFFLIFTAMTLWVIGLNIDQIPRIFGMVFESAFTGSAPVGGFVGSTLLVTMAQGSKQGSYSGDLGIGFSSIINSETEETDPKKQASLAIFGILLDTFMICTMSVVLVLVTDQWESSINPAFMVQSALGEYFPHLDAFMPFLIFLLGFSTIIAYFIVGLKCAKFLSPKYGEGIYYVYAVVAWILFSFVDSIQALVVMNLAAGFLLMLNTVAFFKLRNEIEFDL